MWPIQSAGWTMTAVERATLEQLRHENQRAARRGRGLGANCPRPPGPEPTAPGEARRASAGRGPTGGPVPAARVQEDPRWLPEAARSAAWPPRGPPERPRPRR